MLLLSKFGDPALGKKLLARVSERAARLAGRLGRRPVFMEVCGTHTMAISRSGLRSLLKETMELRSGPGCPVCVTAAEDLDKAITLAQLPGVTVATFGDMVRVPGSTSSLDQERARGAQVQVVYSPAEAVELATANQEGEVIFIGVGFETTAPLVALCLVEAQRRRLRNFSVLSLHKLVPPALKALLADPQLGIDGLILPGHVSAIIGRKAYDFIAREYGIPAVVSGFESLDILGAIYFLLDMLEKGEPAVVNGYTRVVKEKGNRHARAVMEKCFEVTAASWRGLGEIPASGLRLQDDYVTYDAAARFSVPQKPARPRLGCRCGEILKGKLTPPECPLFAQGCTPARPAGPCMVSSEGACAAYYQYERT